ncbi:MerR family transcriptional regulator [Virgisporangium aurantiacum]|uniref:HTH merR-type domain-containing protein n=1 Tax=Virgisporangium aurantiacum TaxID=175570 RepID=A0A8J3Z8A8_9ACTN|nr:MerR family transcriptional regulator [Virgisporangium aurantiacum]GIJ58237.1 hypothetical protein Vau01_057530 [Virgisporangium aurantiacum]
MGFEWTLDELVARVSAALEAVDYPGAPNGRVRDVPDRRAIRWYTTIGLLDRPDGMRGRSALYGPRHLAQLVAIKRRQAQGRSLAEIQAELVGATDTVVYGIAGLDPAHAGTPKEPAPRAPRGAFWAQPVTAPAPEPVVASREPGAPQPEAPQPAAPESGREGAEGVLTGVTLPGGVVLLLPTRPDHDDLAALRAAAQPLIDLLTTRGLLHDPRRSS